MDPGQVEGFIRVDVPDPRDDRLVEQGDLDGPTGATEHGGDLTRSDRRCFRTHPIEKPLIEVHRVGSEMDTAESPGIDEPQTDSSGFVILEDPGHVTMRWNPASLLPGDLEAAGHPESDHRGGLILESQDQLLSPAIQ